MKKIVLAVLAILSAALPSNAQKLLIDNSGESLPAIYGARIERTLAKEAEFYKPLGLPDTLTIHLKVFRDHDSANAFLRRYAPAAYGKYCSGMFIPKIETAVLSTNGNMDSAVKTLFHETSHFFYSKAMRSSPLSATNTANSLNEGLAAYFEYMIVRKDGTTVQRPDILYIRSVKTLIELDELDLTEYLRMTHAQFIDKSRHDGNISYFVSYVIVNRLFDKLGMDGMRNLLSSIRSGTSYEKAVEDLYPGGTQALEEDIRSFVQR